MTDSKPIGSSRKDRTSVSITAPKLSPVLILLVLHLALHLIWRAWTGVSLTVTVLNLLRSAVVHHAPNNQITDTVAAGVVCLILINLIPPPMKYAVDIHQAIKNGEEILKAIDPVVTNEEDKKIIQNYESERAEAAAAAYRYSQVKTISPKTMFVVKFEWYKARKTTKRIENAKNDLQRVLSQQNIRRQADISAQIPT
ncbi:hypothetical protein C8R43DRAFT_946041 [Mycena crocata]|nr:hypothetical protein C8R43DRAFT_946041 [Mycena crocata]